MGKAFLFFHLQVLMYVPNLCEKYPQNTYQYYFQLPSFLENGVPWRSSPYLHPLTSNVSSVVKLMVLEQNSGKPQIPCPSISSPQLRSWYGVWRVVLLLPPIYKVIVTSIYFYLPYFQLPLAGPVPCCIFYLFI